MQSLTGPRPTLSLGTCPDPGPLALGLPHGVPGGGARPLGLCAGFVLGAHAQPGEAPERRAPSGQRLSGLGVLRAWQATCPARLPSG